MNDWALQRIEALEKRDNRNAGFVSGSDWYQFRMSCTCPPSTSLYMRGGTQNNYAIGNTRDNLAYLVPDRLVDFLDYDVLTYMHTESAFLATDFPFVSPYYYQGYVLILRTLTSDVTNPSPEDWTFWLVGHTDEFATGPEAEASVELNGMWLEFPWVMGYPLCGVVLRNDGITGPGRHILPIDAANRGRSYVWPSDVRPRWLVV